jgi:hypothetical protein
MPRNAVGRRALFHHQDLHIAFPAQHVDADVVLVPEQLQVHDGPGHLQVVDPKMVTLYVRKW